MYLLILNLLLISVKYRQTYCDTWSTASRSRASSTRKAWSFWSRSRGRPQGWSEGWSTVLQEKNEELWKGLIMAFWYLKKSYKQETDFLRRQTVKGQGTILLN